MELGAATKWLLERGFVLELCREQFTTPGHGQFWRAGLATRDRKEATDSVYATSVEEAVEALEVEARKYFSEQREKYEGRIEDGRAQVEHYQMLERQFPRMKRKP